MKRTQAKAGDLTAAECPVVLEALGALLYDPGTNFMTTFYSRLVSVIPSSSAPLLAQTLSSLAATFQKVPRNVLEAWESTAKSKATSFTAQEACMILEAMAILSYKPDEGIIAALVKAIEKVDLSTTLDAPQLAGFIRGCGKLSYKAAVPLVQSARDVLENQLQELNLGQLLGILDSLAALDVAVDPAFMQKFSEASIAAASASPF